MLRTLITSAIIAVSASSAMAQAQAPASRPATTPTPTTTTAPATTTARPAPVAAPTGLVPSGAASTAQAAITAAKDKYVGRQSACLAKGPAYKWIPPHVAGDPNPKGGFYTGHFNGGCRLMSMKEALDKGLITMNAAPKR